MPDVELISLADLPTRVPEWPFSPWSTADLIRKRRLACVRAGRRVFVTRAQLAEYIARNIQPAESTPG